MKRRQKGAPLSPDYFAERSVPEPNSGCWIWLMATNWKGYGVLRFGGRNIAAHRAAYELFNGSPVAPALDVCHRCDNPACINPDHLFVGTRVDNMRDCIRKGRFRFRNNRGGEDCPAAKLTRADVIAIRSDPRSGRAIARAYNVDKGTIAGIRRGTSWRSV